MPDVKIVEWLNEKYEALRPFLTERSRRLWAATEAASLGRGGVAAVMSATGMSSATVNKGLGELAGRQESPPDGRIRRPGGGRKGVRECQPGFSAALAALVEATTRGDPERPLRWTCKSTSQLSRELGRAGFAAGPRTVAKELKRQEFSLQSNRKTREGQSHPDRNAQVQYINAQVMDFQRRNQPAISVDTKKKELVGDEGWVSVGIDHDTARFAAASIKRWWRKMGRRRYRQARQLLITADCGGSNSSRTWLWKVALQELADDLGLELVIRHFPPGTSKWNKIEHRMFCHITRNWRGRPLTSYAAIVQLIGNTTTRTGLKICSELDENEYPTKQVATPEQIASLQLAPDAFHGDWNYTVTPH